ncbi:MAG: phosphatase PAP2 family protein [Eubacteriales bacterium]|nr:phosphatase PAP2 family protein [Eubacteriales bacterium]
MEFLQFLSGIRTPAGDILFQGITYLAQEFFVVGVICWLFWCADKKLAYSLGFAYFTSGLMVQGLKITFRIPRPWILDPEFTPVASAVSGATGYSFPSGHTQSITSLFGTLALHWKKVWAKILCFILIFAVMFSRMYLGCHTPKDVGVSFAVTMVCVLINYYFFYGKPKEASEKDADLLSGHESTVALIMGAACLFLTVYALLLEHRGVIELIYAQDCLKASGAGMAFALGFYVEKRRIRFDIPRTLKGKIIRMIVGLAAALLLLEGIKPVIGASLPASWFRYFITVFWIVILYPALFTAKSSKI